MSEITSDDIKKVRAFVDIKNRGMVASSVEVTTLYNKLTNAYHANTTCSTCIRQRIEQMEKIVNDYLAQVKVEEPKDEVVSEQPKTDEAPKKKVARKSKK